MDVGGVRVVGVRGAIVGGGDGRAMEGVKMQA
jgi:hypothetical protein